MNIKLESIGSVNSSRMSILDDNWDKEEAYIEIREDFSEQTLYGLNEFSHVEVIFYMDQVRSEKIEMKARHPRNREDWPKVGIFSQRGKNRPNQLGLTVCKIIKIEGKRLYLKGLDAIDGTPVLDIKPWMKEFAPRGATYQANWVNELMKSYWDES